MNLKSETQATQEQDTNAAFVEELKALLSKHQKGLKPAINYSEEGIVAVLQVIDVKPEEAPVIPDEG